MVEVFSQDPSPTLNEGLSSHLITNFLSLGNQIQELQLAASRHGDDLKQTKNEMSELSRLLQRIRCETGSVRKQVGCNPAENTRGRFHPL